MGEKLVEVHDRRSMSRVVCTLLPAIADGRIADVLALVDPHVVCITATRPALTRYEGHAGMIRMVTDLRAVYGRYRVNVDPDVGNDAAAEGGPRDARAGTRVVVRMAAVRQTDGGEVALPPALVVATVRWGLVTSLETIPQD